MSTEQALHTISLPVAADLSANQYYLVKIDTNGRAALAGEGAHAIGVLQDAPAAIDRPGNIAVSGITKVVCGGSITKGDALSPDSNGKAVTVGSSDDYQVGIALEAGASGKIISMLIEKLGKS